jgi:hypothetical protein
MERITENFSRQVRSFRGGECRQYQSALRVYLHTSFSYRLHLGCAGNIASMTRSSPQAVADGFTNIWFSDNLRFLQNHPLVFICAGNN